MKVYDISLTIHEDMPVWKNDRKPTIKKLLELKKGDRADVTYIKMCAHTGTHVDAPAHFLEGGKSVETLPLDVLIGPAHVVEALDADYLTPKVLQALDIPPGTTRLLIHTRNSKQWELKATEFIEDFVAFSPAGAQYLVDIGIKLIGIDYLGVATIPEVTPVHETLLKANIVILEGINLTGVPAGDYTLHCLPIKLANADGAPARTILTKT